MEKIRILLLMLVTFPCLFSCTDYSVGQQPVDNVPPGKVTNVKVENIPGGAILTYKLPSDQDLLYVKATYFLKDTVKMEAKSSIFKDTLKVQGFGDTKQREVTLTAVDASGNESESVAVKVTPLTPPVVSIGESLVLSADFGGMTATWENPTKAEVSVRIDTINKNKEWETAETCYTSTLTGSGSVRGQDTIPRQYRVYVQDRWGNKSPYLIKELTPLYETQWDKSLWTNARLASDVDQTSGWVMEHIWDGIYGDVDNGFSCPPGTGKWPVTITINLGTVGKISRIKYYQRGYLAIFQEGNLKRFEVYGATKKNYVDDLSKWTLLGSFTSHKPSGLPFGQWTAEDKDVACYSGENFTFPIALSVPIQFIRIRVLETWAGGDNFQIGELFVYGDNRPIFGANN